MNSKVIYLGFNSLLVGIKGGYHVEGIDPSLRCGSDVYESASEILSEVIIFVLGVENKYLRVFCRKVGKNGFGCKGFTRAGFAHNYHVRVNALSVALEEVYYNREASARSENRSAVVHYS